VNAAAGAMLEGMVDDRYERGMAVRRAVLGDAHVERAAAAATALDEGWQRHITESVWGELWVDPTWDHRTRSLVTLAILVALGRDEMQLHMKASLNTGVTDADLQQLLRHVAVYAGVPAANHGYGVAKSARSGTA
jgi:4-carboxymuconolactone decarboxylase